MSTDANLPSDLRDADIDPPVCEQCQVNENRIEDMQDALSDALEFLLGFELSTRQLDFSNEFDREGRRALLACIERVKKLA